MRVTPAEGRTTSIKRTTVMAIAHNTITEDT